jgi:4-amino-4-deoxy-L-arabinose transferase-like glycosyltransferase
VNNNQHKWVYWALGIGIALRFLITWYVFPASDAAWHLNIARYIGRNNTIPVFEQLGMFAFWAPPFFHIITSLVYKTFILFGEAVAVKAMQFVAPVFGSLSLLVFYTLAKKLVDERKAVFATIFFTFIPLHLYFSTLSFVDIVILFMSLYALYLLINGNVYQSAVIAGLGMLTKTTMLAMIPLLLYVLIMQYKSLKKIIVYFIITILVGLPWYVQQFKNFGSPLYPFLNGLFSKLGFTLFSYPIMWPEPTYNPGNIIVTMFLSLFGVPVGLVENLKFFPLQPYSVLIWIGATFLFLLPLFISFSVKKERKIFWITLIWIVSYLAVLLFHYHTVGDVFLRIFLPGLPGVALLWGIGADYFYEKTSFKKLFLAFLVLSVLLFSSGEVVKARTAGLQHAKYLEDYTWFQENTPQDALFFPRAKELAFYLDREHVPVIDQAYDKEKVYVWGEKDRPLTVDVGKLVYTSNKTEVQVYTSS